MKYKCDDYVEIVGGFFSGKKGFVEGTQFVGFEFFGKEFGRRTYTVSNNSETYDGIEEKHLAPTGR